MLQIGRKYRIDESCDLLLVFRRQRAYVSTIPDTIWQIHWRPPHIGMTYKFQLFRCPGAQSLVTLALYFSSGGISQLA